MHCKFRFAALLTLFLLAGCARKPSSKVVRLAIPPFENLSDGRTEEWAARALSEAAAASLSGSHKVLPILVSSRNDAAWSGATEVLDGYFTVSRGRLRLSLRREAVAQRRTLGRFTASEPWPDGLFDAARRLARWIDPEAPGDAFTGSIEALRNFAEARSSSSAEQAAAAYERATAADPDFGAAYVGWTRLLLARGDRTGFRQVLARAQARAGRLSEAQRSELDLLKAVADGDPTARRRALERLSRTAPADVDLLHQLAREDMARRNYDAAAAFYARITELNPMDADAWNQLGYAQARRRNLKAARLALAEYRRLAPEEANPLDSLGDVHYLLGDFREAEKYYLEAHRKNPNFLNGAALYKAARARLMSGDLDGADALLKRYVEERAAIPDSAAQFRQAQWLYMTGRKREAFAAMEKMAGATLGEMAALAALQLAWWSQEATQVEAAHRWGRKALDAATSPVLRRMASIFLKASGGTASEKLSTGDEKMAEVLRMLFAGQYAGAVPLLEQLRNSETLANPELVEALLAWALVETGQATKAVSLLATYELPSVGLEDPLAVWVFPKLLRARAAVLAAQGRRAESAAMENVYRRVSGE